MATAYICVVRNDLDANGLQVLDLKPNDSQRNYIYDGQGQTSYLSFLAQHDTVATHDAGAGVLHTSAVYYGLAAYAMDNIENVGGGAKTLTAAQANAFAALSLTGLGNGGAATLALINAAINAVPGVTNSDLNGLVLNSHSTGSVAGALKILQGEVYRLPYNSVMSGAAGAFLTTGPGVTHLPLGDFAVQGDSDFRGMRQFEATGELLISCASGVLSHLKSANYVWLNPAFTYGAAGTALRVNGVTHIGATGAARAVVVYDKDGNVL